MLQTTRWTCRSAGRIGLGLLLAFVCMAAALANSPRSLRFERIGVSEGLPQESVLSMLQDRQGFVWFSTQAGVGRFDGYRMNLFKNDPSDPGSLVDNYVSASFEDDQGRLWFGTKGGLSRFVPDSQSFVRYGASGPPMQRMTASITAIADAGAGALWLATNDGLTHFDPASGSIVKLRHDRADPASLSDNQVNALVRSADGALWVGTAKGLNRLPAGSDRFERFALADAGAQVLALALAKDHVLWVGTERGLQAWQIDPDGRARHLPGMGDGAGQVPVLALYHDRDNTLWVGTEFNGLKRRDPASGHFLSYRHRPLDQYSLSDNRVASILVDRTGTLWAGTWFAGANRTDLASGGFERFTYAPGESEGIASNKVRAIVGNASGQLWLGTTGAGLNLLDMGSGTVRHWRHLAGRRSSLPDDVIVALATSAKRVWVGGPAGLSWMDPQQERFTKVSLGPDPNANYINRLLIDRSGMLWVLTRGGLHRHDPARGATQTWRHNPRDPHSLGENRGQALLEDRAGMLWVGTDNGLDRFDRATGRFTHFRHDPNDPSGLRHSRIHYLFESRAGQLWVGSAGGLHRAETGSDGRLRFRFFPLNRTRTADPVGAILEDRAGMLWVSTTAGITRLDPGTGQIQTYTGRDGMVDGSFFIGSAFALSDGRLAFGGMNGLTVFDPAAIRKNPFAPVVLITDFLVFNQSVRAGQMLGGEPFKGAIHNASAITLSHRDSVLSFEFAALHFADPMRNRYAYRLEGFDEGWVDTGADKRYATYTNLDPGRYVFRVRAANKDGVWNTSPTSLQIWIQPPLWQTWWFRVLALALVLGTAYALLRLRVRALVQQKTSLERKVGTRTAELQQQKDAVERQKHDLELAHRNISLLSEIGRKLTAKLDSESIMVSLYNHVNELMDASVFGIGVYRRELGVIEYPFAIERGKRYAPYTRSMDEPNQLAVWCIANEREVFINNLELEYADYIGHLEHTTGVESMGTLDDGSLPTVPQSMLYAPISINGRVFGVVSVHSYQSGAYQRIHLDMLRTLAAYVGVAFDNAEAYRQLKSTQAQLVAQDKLAALGSLVAGVAHELNTPIGNSLLMASTLQEKTNIMGTRFESQNMRRSELNSFIQAAQEALALIMRSLHNAAHLVNSFKQVAVDQASAQRRHFNLEQATHEIVATMMSQVRKSGHHLELDIAGSIELDSFPGSYGQVIINFVNNALLHAFEGRPGGHMRISASCMHAGRVRIEFHDDGCGIPAQHQARIFDPFFTTKMGKGGSGLGLNIAYNIVTSLLEGQILVESCAEHGTTFILDLPLCVSAPVSIS